MLIASMGSLMPLPELQKKDKIIQEIREKCENGVHDKRHAIHGDILFRFDEPRKSWQIIVPASLTHQIIEYEHSKMGHAGVHKTLRHMQNYYSSSNVRFMPTRQAYV